MVLTAESLFRWLIVGRNLNQKYILQTMASEIDEHRASVDQDDKTVSTLQLGTYR